MSYYFFDEIMHRMITYNVPDIKRINHAMKVFSFTQALCFGENAKPNIQIVAGITGILHDIGIHEAENKYNSTAWDYQEKEGPPIAKEMLEDIQIDKRIKERCYYIIGNHHSYEKIDGLDFQILVEADFFVNIDEDGRGRIGRHHLAEKTFKTKTGKEILGKIFSLNNADDAPKCQ